MSLEKAPLDEKRAPSKYDQIKWGFKVINDRPYFRDDGFRLTDASKVYYDAANEVIIEVV